MEGIMKIRGILFDFNGTMLFDSELQEKAWKVFIKNKLVKEISKEENTGKLERP